VGGTSYLPFRPQDCGGLLTQGIGLRPQPWAGLYRPVGPGGRHREGRSTGVGASQVFGFSMNGAEIAANADCFLVNASRFLENGGWFTENCGCGAGCQPSIGEYRGSGGG
jgi:hypothetical protein